MIDNIILITSQDIFGIFTHVLRMMIILYLFIQTKYIIILYYIIYILNI